MKHKQKKKYKWLSDERGSLTVFSLTIFSVIFALVGISFDLSQYEMRRISLQASLDNATLAAASLSSNADPESVLRNYLNVSDINADYTLAINRQFMSVSHRSIEAEVSARVDTIFMAFFGIDHLDIQVKSAAREYAPKIELSLVLDISQSMGSGRLSALKPVARNFVTELLTGNTVEDPDAVAISIIPYNMQVNAGRDLYETAFSEAGHGYSYCVEWDTDSFDEKGLSTSTYTQANHMGWYNEADNYPGYTRGGDYNTGLVDIPLCLNDDRSAILPFANDQLTLIRKISQLRASGNTSIDIGMKWAVALLDPDAQPIIEELTTSTGIQSIDPKFAERPSAYDDPEIVKAIIVMSDGENTLEYRPKETMRGDGLSGVWMDASSNISFEALNEVEGARELNWDEMWAMVPHFAYSSHHFDTTDPRGNSKYWDMISSEEKNTQLQSTCSAAKEDNQVIIFSIAFEAPERGREALRDCASGPAFYFEADESSIGSVFASIRNSIQKLKLVK
jgi:Flp pilus assembly protein TadG